MSGPVVALRVGPRGPKGLIVYGLALEGLMVCELALVEL